jgi:hypothetical protein
LDKERKENNEIIEMTAREELLLFITSLNYQNNK